MWLRGVARGRGRTKVTRKVITLPHSSEQNIDADLLHLQTPHSAVADTQVVGVQQLNEVLFVDQHL